MERSNTSQTQNIVSRSSLHLDVWSRALMVRSYPWNGRVRYGPNSPWERHDDGGGPSSDTALSRELRALAKRYGINQKTVAKWKARTSVTDRPTGPKQPKSTVLSIEDEAIVVAFRRHTLLPLDDCLYALQATIPHLTRSSLHRCLHLPAMSAHADGRYRRSRLRLAPSISRRGSGLHQ